jgi:hypothetical protein
MEITGKVKEINGKTEGKTEILAPITHGHK